MIQVSGVILALCLVCLASASFSAGASAPVVMTVEELGRGVPEYAKEKLPEWLEPFVGRRGLPAPWNQVPGILAEGVAGLDRWQANRFIVYRSETAKFLYADYTPLKVEYKKGASPLVEKTAEECTRGAKTDTDKALAMLTQVFPGRMKHPTIVPKGPKVAANRDATDDALLASGCGWCNEQARVLVRLCQACGIPARIVHLFYSDDKTGHTIVEFHADGRWVMADASFVVVFPGKDGRLMSAAQCHEKENLPLVAEAYQKRLREIAGMTDGQLGGEKEAAAFRADVPALAARISGLKTFALINHLPPR